MCKFFPLFFVYVMWRERDGVLVIFVLDKKIKDDRIQDILHFFSRTEDFSS